MNKPITPVGHCPNCKTEIVNGDTAGHRMIFYPGWTHHGEPEWECGNADTMLTRLPPERLCE